MRWDGSDLLVLTLYLTSEIPLYTEETGVG